MKALLSDLGNVLIHFSHAKMCEQIAAVCQLPAQQVRKIFFDEGLLSELETGRLTTAAMYAHFTKLTSHPIEERTFLEAFCQIFTLNEEMVDFLHHLKAKEVRLILISNISEAHFTFVQKQFSLLSLFDHFALSYQIGACKPEEKIYRRALVLAQSAPQDCFYIDDIPEYVEAATSLAIPSHTFHTLRELKHAKIFQEILSSQ